MNIIRMVILFLLLTVSFPAHAGTDCDVDTGCSDAPIESQGLVVPEINYADFLRLYGSDEVFLLVDVRSQANYEYAHIKGAINLFVIKLTPQQIAEMLPDKNAKIVVYCSSHSCAMSEHAARYLIKLGYKNILNYAGGIEEWRKYQQPMDRAPVPAVTTNP